MEVPFLFQSPPTPLGIGCLTKTNYLLKVFDNPF
jgi:hypothetical protein